MQAKQAQGGTAVLSKAPQSQNKQAKPMQQHLASVKVAVSKQSSATRANLTGRFKVN
jgi:hypothetical protein